METTAATAAGLTAAGVFDSAGSAFDGLSNLMTKVIGTIAGNPLLLLLCIGLPLASIGIVFLRKLLRAKAH